MKVLMITEGGNNIGFGHLTRCISLYQAFEKRGILPEFIVNGDETVGCMLKNKKHKVFNWLKDQRKIFSIVKFKDMVIIDSYLAEYDFYKKLSDLVGFCIYIDDNKRLDYPKGIVVNGNKYAEEINYPEREDVVYLLGAKYIPLRKEFWDVPEKNIEEKLGTVMTTFGGDDAKNMTPKILRFLREYYPTLKKNVIVGKAFKNINEIQQGADKNTNLIYYPSGEKMKEVMLESDMAISGGGQSLYELARVGIPTLGICVAENQLENIMGWEKAGFLEYVGWYNDKNLLEKIKSMVDRLEDTNTRRNKSEVGRKYIDGKGSLRVVEILLFNWFKDNLYLRNADFEDALDIFTLSNDETVRSNSFNPEKIEWEHHLNWLKEKLKDRNCVFLIVSDNSGGFYGQVRFDITPEMKEGIINISLEKTIRGLGLASFIVDEAVNELLRVKDVRIIKAYVKERNTPSIRSFEKAKFRFLESLEIRGNKAKSYIREIG